MCVVALKHKNKKKKLCNVYINTCMSYALMLFEELFASQLSVPSSPVHPIKCTTIQMKETETSDKTETNDRRRRKSKNHDEFRQHGKKRDNKEN